MWGENGTIWLPLLFPLLLRELLSTGETIIYSPMWYQGALFLPLLLEYLQIMKCIECLSVSFVAFSELTNLSVSVLWQKQSNVSFSTVRFIRKFGICISLQLNTWAEPMFFVCLFFFFFKVATFYTLACPIRKQLVFHVNSFILSLTVGILYQIPTYVSNVRYIMHMFF